MLKKFLPIIILLVFLLIACNNQSMLDNTSSSEEKQGNIYLYGEFHGQEKILVKELEIWQQYYHEENMRHLFIEWPYFKAQLLNVWMKEDNDDILLEITDSNFDLDAVLEFYRGIKETCPDTVFHGNDVQSYKDKTLGNAYKQYLEENDLTKTDAYTLNEVAMEQVKQYSKTGDDSYRESKLVENFIREFEKLDGENVMGIYGLTHVKKENYIKDNETIQSMASQLDEKYGERLETYDLTDELLKGLLEEPMNTEELLINDQTYNAEYYGITENTGSKLILSYEYWKLVNVYEDFKDLSKTGLEIPQYHYPMKLIEDNVYVIIATLKDHSKMTYFTIVDGTELNGVMLSKEVSVDN